MSLVVKVTYVPVNLTKRLARLSFEHLTNYGGNKGEILEELIIRFCSLLYSSGEGQVCVDPLLPNLFMSLTQNFYRTDINSKKTFLSDEACGPYGHDIHLREICAAWKRPPVTEMSREEYDAW